MAMTADLVLDHVETWTIHEEFFQHYDITGILRQEEVPTLRSYFEELHILMVLGNRIIIFKKYVNVDRSSPIKY
jgi:hypothetical protein